MSPVTAIVLSRGRGSDSREKERRRPNGQLYAIDLIIHELSVFPAPFVLSVLSVLSAISAPPYPKRIFLKLEHVQRSNRSQSQRVFLLVVREGAERRRGRDTSEAKLVVESDPNRRRDEGLRRGSPIRRNPASARGKRGASIRRSPPVSRRCRVRGDAAFRIFPCRARLDTDRRRCFQRSAQEIL